MPVFSIDIEKILGTESWTNRYFVNAPSLQDARSLAANFWTAEQEFHVTSVRFDRVRVATTTPNDDTFVIDPIGLTGLRPPVGNIVPLFNCVRVDFPKGVGRPYRKYYRGVLDEATMVFTTISAPLLGDIEASLANIDGDNATLTGDILRAGIPVDQVAMRQLRRGSRRRTQPIL